MNRSRPLWWRVSVAFGVGAAFGVFSSVQFFPAGGLSSNVSTTREELGGGQAVGETNSDVVIDSNSATTAAFASQQLGERTPPNLACTAGRNGGATETGITGTSIRMATTVVRSGIGAAFLGDVQFAMEAVRNRVNREGGICGRRLDIRYADDGWSPDRGAQFLRNFIQEGVFAIPVGPSSEGLRIVIDSGDIARVGIPVVGTDGMLIDQYKDPWVWPVAVATASAARLMAIHAHKLGARSFSIVFDRNYRFGVEAAQAFNNAVRRITGRHIPGYNNKNACQQSFCGVDAGQSSYETEVTTFRPGDVVVMFLEPATALTWMASTGAPTAQGRIGLWGAQPLFTRDFAVQCQGACDQMWVWTGYKPPIEDYAGEPAVRTFVSDLKRTKVDADEFNAFAEGGYVGMQLLVHALQKVGPYLTRARLKTVLDSMNLATGLTLEHSLSWRPGKHFASATMQAFAIQYKGTFGGWRAEDIFRDPTPYLGQG